MISYNDEIAKREVLLSSDLLQTNLHSSAVLVVGSWTLFPGPNHLI